MFSRPQRRTVTAVLCNFNEAITVAASLRAYLRQSRRPERLLVWDDCSTDSSTEIIDQVCQDQPWVERIYNSKNAGHIANCAAALKDCTTDFIYFGASDDLVYENLFAEAMRALEAWPGAGIFCSNYAFLNLSTSRVDNHELPFGRRRGFIDGRELRRILDRLPHFAFPSHTVVLNVAELRKAGGFISGLEARVDWFYQLVLASRGGVAFSPKVTARYTLGGGQSFSDKHLRNEARDRATLRRMLDLLLTPEYEDVADLVLRPAIMRGSPAMADRVAALIRDDERYSRFRRFLQADGAPRAP